MFASGFGSNRLGDHLSIDGGDLTAGIVERSHGETRVASIGIEIRFATDLDDVQLNEEDRVERQQCHRETSNALVHDGTCSCRPARRAAQRSRMVGRSGISPNRRAEASLVRMRSARMA